jgi:hypothetical protein
VRQRACICPLERVFLGTNLHNVDWYTGIIGIYRYYTSESLMLGMDALPYLLLDR